MVGSTYFLALLLSSCATICAHELTLSMTNLDEQQISEVLQGEPFLIHIIHTGTSALPHAPHLENTQQLACFQACPMQTTINIINNAQEVRHIYTYTCRYDMPGKFALGPARCQVNTRLVQSNPLIIRVQTCTQKKTDQTKDPEIQISACDSVYVHQQNIITIKVFYQKPIIRCQLERMQIQHAYLDPLCEPYHEEMTKDNTTLHALVYQFACCAQTPGTLVIPSITATIIREKDEGDNSFFAHMRSFFGSDQEQITIRTHPLVITVKPLPVSSQTIHGVGAFDSFCLQADTTHTDQSKGISVSMRISGEGNVAYARLPELTLADTLRAYQADTLVTRNQQKPEQATRCTTWVLQALSPGTYTLPALTFNFFNPVIHAYQQLRSTPITLKISPCKPNIQTTRRALSSCTSNMMRIAHIPRPLCAFLVMLAVCILIGAHIIPLYQETVIHAVRRRWRTYQLIRACTQKNAQRVYEQWFLWFSAQQEHATGHETLEELGTHTLQKQAQQESWCAYVHEIKTAAFSARNKKLNHTLCTQTRRWIRALEKAQ